MNIQLKITTGIPVIVRSFSLLEDNLGYAFAGKYESVFCPNQGISENRFDEFLTALKTVYSSVLKPDALLYRIRRKLINTDDQMAALVMGVEGRNLGEVLMPMIAGVGFSRNFHPCPPASTRTRVCCGSSSAWEPGRWSGWETIIRESMNIDALTQRFELQVYPYFFSILTQGAFADPISLMQYKGAQDRILTFNNLIAKTPFAGIMDPRLYQRRARKLLPDQTGAPGKQQYPSGGERHLCGHRCGLRHGGGGQKLRRVCAGALLRNAFFFRTG